MATQNLIVLATKTPVNLKIFSSDGVLLCQKVLTKQKTKLCICSNSPYLLVIADFNGQTEKKYVENFACSFGFQTILFSFSKQLSLQKILLFDENFGLPIKQAVLKFEK